MRNAPPDFADYRASEITRTPAEILAHPGDLLDWSLSTARGQETWKTAGPVGSQAGTDRFLASLRALEDYLASD